MVEPGGGLDRHPDVAQGRAAQLQAAGGQAGGGGRRGQAGDLVAPPGQEGGEQPPDPARPEHRHPGRRQGHPIHRGTPLGFPGPLRHDPASQG